MPCTPTPTAAALAHEAIDRNNIELATLGAPAPCALCGDVMPHLELVHVFGRTGLVGHAGCVVGAIITGGRA